MTPPKAGQNGQNMRPLTRWERFRQYVIWGSWSWWSFGIHRFHDETILVVSKLKVVIPKRVSA